MNVADSFWTNYNPTGIFSTGMSCFLFHPFNNSSPSSVTMDSKPPPLHLLDRVGDIFRLPQYAI